MKQLVSFFKNADETAYKGIIYQPPVKKVGRKEIMFFDALFMGVPVAVENGLKIVDNAVWKKVISAFVDPDKEMQDYTFENVRFTNVIFKESTVQCDFIECQFDNCQVKANWLAGRFNNCTFNSCDFAHSGIRMWHANKSDFTKCTFEQSNMECDIDACRFKNCSLQQANIYTSLIRDSSFSECDFSFSNLRRNNFFKTKMVAPNFCGATINGTRFDSSEIIDANYENIYITMGGATHDEIAHLKDHIFKAFTPALN